MSFFHNPATALATHAILRIVTGLLFMQHGAQKLFGLLGGVDGHGATAQLASLAGVAGVLEFFGGFLIVIGLFTRVAAFLLSGEMAYAYWMVHVARGGLIPVYNRGEFAALLCFVFLFLAFNGAGAWSVDALRARRAAVPA
ncbi:MAG TPA: DoxX family protein [Gemmatimonadaceae bacterium]|nr:DoxX family protein [Gemmatimonadaceae bacterium]